VIRWEQRFHAFRPFDDDHAALFEEFAEPDRGEIFTALHAICVKMKDLHARRIVDAKQDEGRAADRARVATQPANKSSNELCLTRAKIAMEGNAFPAHERSRQFGGDGFGLRDAF